MRISIATNNLSRLALVLQKEKYYTIQEISRVKMSGILHQSYMVRCSPGVLRFSKQQLHADLFNSRLI